LAAERRHEDQGLYRGLPFSTVLDGFLNALALPDD
jgi:hypothetical protein